jgi:uncharacterized repeat protein (TIGR01451 family)
MFEKLLSLMPYNPSLAHQMSFYGRRMREEAAIRRTGVLLIVLTFMIQFFAVLSPPQPTSANGDNSLVTGGISSAADGAKKCRDNVRNYGTILAYYGITCDDLAGAATTTVSSKEHSGRLFSIGHNPQGFKEEQPVHIPGAGTLFWRPLHAWDTGASSSYKALHFKNAAGRTFWIIYNCGNIVALGIPPPAPKPHDKCPLKPGFQDSEKDCDVCPETPGIQKHPENCDVCPNKAGVQKNREKCDVCTNLPGIQLNRSDCDVCPLIPGTQKKVEKCDVCPNKDGVQPTAEECDVCPALTGVQTSADECDVCDNKDGVQTTEAECDVCTDQAGVQLSADECFTICQYDSTLHADDDECKPCDQGSGPQDNLACVSIHKTAGNITAGVANADGTTANAGDVITYTLYAQNGGKATVPGFTFQENLSDVLDYADVTDMHGGSLSDKLATWPAVNIGAGQTVTVQVTVKVKDPIPQTPGDPADPEHFDLNMNNVYGNAVNIKLPGSPTKAVETVATSLPNTGPGTSLFIGAMTVIFAAYFYARARLLAKESVLAIQENSGA